VSRVRRRFEGATVVITGASRGLGRALACAFAAEGAFTFIGHRDAERAADPLAAVRRIGDGALLRFDLRDGEAVDAAMAHVLDTRGQIDVLVNNAALVDQSALAMANQDTLDAVIDVNLGGTLRCSRAVARPMMARGRGAIINVSSVAALRALEGSSAYAASKAGIIALTRSLAKELAPKAVRVNAVVPGFLDVGMGARLDADNAERQRARIPLGRFGSADEVARAVTFLASDEASYVTGAALVIDGGLSA
jgi:3-oxoacyl-[acyl-carrier protein] reductase